MIIPDNITFCGPILLPSAPVADSDAELLSWLKRKPTVLISMGTLVIMDDSLNQEIASGLRVFLSHHPDVQILWKIQKRFSYEEVNYQTLALLTRSYMGFWPQNLLLVKSELSTGSK